ncbi:ABC transporter permease [Wenjunlia tyrosinilytica]|uniref:Ribose ABC transporter permease n=1 Tax=Wenjunlia tyrosinilytica TaxID=1544741 RepID=A0A917ZVX4_9ACTN|nr:ABC transporter permease [Wenjunlia tyrosinilytica]GGO93077.1 ribose ABC transporter permease [Wenjunlia tyrosinilytica]
MAATPRLRRLHEAGAAPLFVLVALVVAVGAYDPSFLQPPSLASLLEQAAPLTLLALGQAMVVLTGRIDLANAALASLAGVTLAHGLGTWGPAWILVVVVGATLCGLLVGVIHITTQVPSFIITLGFLGIFAGMSLSVSRADSILVVRGYGSIEWIFYRIFGVPLSYAAVLLVALALTACMGAFPLGRRIRAIGLNERAAACSGIRTGWIVIAMFATSGALAGLAAVLQVAQLQSAGATTSDALLLPAIAAVIVGGTAISGGVGGVGRTLCGALVIALLRVGLDLVGIDAAFQPILYGGIVILAIAATADRRRGTSVA